MRTDRQRSSPRIQPVERRPGALSYEVELREGRLYLTGCSPGLVRRAPVAGQACHVVLYQRGGPCPGCPLVPITEPMPESNVGVVLASRSLWPLKITYAVQSAPGRFRLTIYEVFPALFKQLISARIASLSRQAGLTPRESQVLEGIARGLWREAIAEELQITARTVKFHQQNLRSKLGLESRADLMRLLF